MEELPTLGVKAWLWILLLVGAVVEVHPGCVWRDMRFRAGYVLTRASCGECTCESSSGGYKWTCPSNVECEKRDVVYDCIYNGRKVEAGLTVPKVNDACANNCTCHVGGVLTCTNNTCTTPTPPIRNPSPTCLRRGMRRAIGEVWFPNPRKRCHSCECEEGGLVVCKDNCAHCYYNNTRLNVGDQVGSLDGCNTCTCMQEGRISCTEIFCGSVQCVYQGKVYRIGDVFKKEGDCNLCDCGVDGQVECGTQSCPQPPTPPPSPQTPAPANVQPPAPPKAKSDRPLSGAQPPPPSSGPRPPPPPSDRQKPQPPSSPHAPPPAEADHPDPPAPAPFTLPPVVTLYPTPPSSARKVLQNNTCTFRGRSYKLGEQWAWHEGAGSQGPEGAWPGGKGSACDKCTCVKDVDGTVTWVCNSVCSTSSPPAQQRSLWSMVRELLASAFSRMSRRNF